jgi:hypothetical protein
MRKICRNKTVLGNEHGLPVMILDPLQKFINFVSLAKHPK